MREGEVLVQPRDVQVGAVVEERVDRGEAHRAAEIAHQVVQAGGILHPLGRERTERHIVDRHHREHQPDAAEDLRPEQLPEVPVARQRRHPPGAGREEQEADGEHHARIELAGEAARDRRGQEHRKARDEQGLADHQRVVAADLREIERVDEGEPIEPDAEHEREQAAEREIAIRERLEIDDRRPRGERAPEEQDRRQSRHPGEQHDAVVGEPVVARALFQHIFQRAEEAGHRQKSDPVEMIEQTVVRLVEVDQQQRRNGRRRCPARC